jgi:hypothetical protein
MRLQYLWVLLPVVPILCVIVGQARPADPITTQALIQGILARSEGVFSGEMTYRESNGFSWKKQPEQELTKTVTFSGPSWRVKWAEDIARIPHLVTEGVKRRGIPVEPPSGLLENDEVSHGGNHLELSRVPQPDHSIRSTARVTQPKPFDYRMPYPPLRVGTFWYECTKKFVEANREKAERKPPTEVNDVPCEIIEWEVTAADKFRAFDGINDLTKNGGRLRVCVALQLGFALPRIQYIGSGGKVAASFDGWDFQEKASGIFIPQHARMQYYMPAPGFYLDFQITDCKKINRSISDATFAVALPDGTEVMDSRSGTHSVLFKMKKGGPIPRDLRDIIQTKVPSFWGWNKRTALLGGAAAGVLLVGVAVLLRLARMRRRQA